MARYHRVVPYLADGRKRWVHVYSRDRASLISQHWHAIRRFLEGWDPDGDGLREFERIRVAGRRLETDLSVIEVLGLEGELEFDEFYRDDNY